MSSFLRLSITCLVICVVFAGLGMFLGKSLAIACRGFDESLIGCASHPLAQIPWFISGVTLLAATVYLLLHFSTREMLGFDREE